MNELYSLLERNYLATVNRGLITKETTIKQFVSKLLDEVEELEESINDSNFDKFELVDCFLVCASAILFFKCTDSIKQKVLINEKRAFETITLDESIALLSNYNKWRRGDDSVPQINPKKLGIAIDTIINHLKAKI